MTPKPHRLIRFIAIGGLDSKPSSWCKTQSDAEQECESPVLFVIRCVFRDGNIIERTVVAEAQA